MDWDVTATYRTADLDVTVGGHSYWMPALDAEEWMATLFPRNGPGAWVDVVPGRLVGATRLRGDIIDGTADMDEVYEVARAALALAAGVKWWVAINLMGLAARAWFAGELLLRDISPTGRPLGAYLLACYQLATRNMTDQKAIEFDQILHRPPPGVDIDDVWDDEAAAQGFLAAMGAAG